MATRKAPLRAPQRPRLTANHAIQSRKVNGFNAKSVEYDGDSLATGEIDPHLTADLALTYRISEKLEQCYPAHPWMVKVSHAQGVAMIKLPLVMKRNEEWVIHISTIAVDPGLKCVMRAAGEILEKYNMPRSGFALDRFLAARDKGPYGAKPKQKLWLPEFASSARPRDDAASLDAASPPPHIPQPGAQRGPRPAPQHLKV